MMATAQGVSASIPPTGAALSAAELREILEYEKIVQFRDAVIAGTHPRIKIPPHLVGKQVNNSTRTVSSPNPPTTSKPPNRSVSGTYHDMSSPYYNNRSPNNQRASTSGLTTMPSKSQINPILLEKSDDLIKAEIQLQRQRLERSLREQIEQQRLAAKLQTSEAVPNFDVAEVLAKALAIVHPSTTTEAEPSVGARSSSDSFDNNTFYSSQHDTPEPSSSSYGQQEPLEVQAGGVVSAHERPAQNYSTNSQIGDPDVVMTGASTLPTNNHLPGQSQSHNQLSPLQQGSRKAALHYEQTREMESSDSSSSIRETGEALKVSPQQRTHTVSIHQSNHLSNSTKMGSWLDFGENDVDEPIQTASDELVQQAPEDDAEPTVIRAHNLSPYAPQPARVSPLATARNPPVLRETLPTSEAPQVAQVAALRKSGISSTDSTPKVVKPSKKKDKKKKRKAKDDVQTPESPYIKPEPRSPSPFGVAPLPRPQKRQRQSGQYAVELNYDEPRYEEEVQERVLERVPYKEPATYERYEERYEPAPRRPEAYQRVEREDVEYRRVTDGQYARRPQSPAAYALPYAPGEVRSIRAASHAIVDRRPREEIVYYREPLPRASVRPDADRERSKSPVMRDRRSPLPMAPPRKPIRIVVDAYGREYIDPTYAAEPVPSVRQSVAPPARYRDEEVIYERAPVRAVSGRAPTEYDEDGRMYRRPSPAEIVPRRVITQPEYAAPEHRAYRQREYSVRPMGPPGEEYIQLRGAPERRQMNHFDEAPREYVPRATSVRPAAAEPARYDIPREYVSRVESVRPEGAPREVATQAQREYSVRPGEAPRREQAGGREGGRYYEEAPIRRPTAEVAFIERPRAREQSVLVYADDVRREVRDVYR